MGRSDQRDYARYHEVLNRAVWSSRQAARILLQLLLQHLDGGTGSSAETLERRRRQDQGAGHLPRPGAFQPVSGGQRPALDLPDVAGPRALGRTPLGLAGAHGAGALTRYYQQQGRQHKKLTDWARQMVMQLRRWLPHRPLVRGRQQLCRAGFAPLLVPP